MSKKFWAEKRDSGERWKPEPGKHEYLVMYDSGYIAVVAEEPYYTSIFPLDPAVWGVVYREDRL